MREITKFKQIASGMPFYDHFKGLEWLSTCAEQIKHPEKGGELNATNASQLLGVHGK